MASECYERLPAPRSRVLFPAYTLALFLGWDALTASSSSRWIPFIDDARLLAVLHWRRADAEPWLDWMRERGLIGLDQLTGSSVVLRLASTNRVIRGLYDELV